MNQIHIQVGHNLNRIRKQKGLSLDKTAQLTGVSKGMLHQIEHGDAQPTVTTVWKIATGLNISFSALLKEAETCITIATCREIPDITEDQGKFRVYLLFPFDPRTRLEIFMIVLSPGCQYTSLPHHDGVQEYITVMQGVFSLRIRDETHSLAQGQAIRFAGDVEHRYMNQSASEVTIQVSMYYMEV